MFETCGIVIPWLNLIQQDGNTRRYCPPPRLEASLCCLAHSALVTGRRFLQKMIVSDLNTLLKIRVIEIKHGSCQVLVHVNAISDSISDAS
jgi:hypothetical protein